MAENPCGTKRLSDLLRWRLAWPLARAFWWAETWCEAIGNSFEDVATTDRFQWRSPSWYRRTRGLRGA